MYVIFIFNSIFQVASMSTTITEAPFKSLPRVPIFLDPPLFNRLWNYLNAHICLKGMVIQSYQFSKGGHGNLYLEDKNVQLQTKKQFL